MVGFRLESALTFLSISAYPILPLLEILGRRFRLFPGTSFLLLRTIINDPTGSHHIFNGLVHVVLLHAKHRKLKYIFLLQAPSKHSFTFGIC